MNTASDDTRIDLALARICALEVQVAALMSAAVREQRPPPQPQPPSASLLSGAMTAMTLMTAKQRATVIAMLGGHSFSEIAQAMSVDPTTIKLHAKAAYAKLGLAGKRQLMEAGATLLDEIAPPGAPPPHGIPRDWMDCKPPSVMAQLLRVKLTSPTGGKGRSAPSN